MAGDQLLKYFSFNIWRSCRFFSNLLNTLAAFTYSCFLAISSFYFQPCNRQLLEMATVASRIQAELFCYSYPKFFGHVPLAHHRVIFGDYVQTHWAPGNPSSFQSYRFSRDIPPCSRHDPNSCILHVINCCCCSLCCPSKVMRITPFSPMVQHLLSLDITSVL